MPRKRSPNCLKCGELKIVMANGAQRCRSCRTRWSNRNYDQNPKSREKSRLYYVLREYGKSLEELEALLRAQKGRCAICLRHWTHCQAPRPSRYEDSFLQHLYVDHDHSTGNVRGLICHRCNVAIGLFEDDADRIEAAIELSQRFQKTHCGCGVVVSADRSNAEARANKLVLRLLQRLDAQLLPSESSTTREPTPNVLRDNLSRSTRGFG
jgi:hypothetical protein